MPVSRVDEGLRGNNEGYTQVIYYIRFLDTVGQYICLHFISQNSVI